MDGNVGRQSIRDEDLQRRDFRTRGSTSQFADISHDNTISLGAQIEDAWQLSNNLRVIEPSPEVLAEIAPLLEAAEDAMSQMIRELAQENPS